MSDLIFPITEDSQVGEVRRIATVVAEELGFNDTQCGKVAIVVTEVAKNLVKHASEGQLLLRSIESKNIPGMEILGLDKGLGMEDIQKCLQDGFSTAGTPGNGLGAISRLSSFFDIYSVPKLGTVLLSRLWSKDLPLAKLNSSLEVGAICVPIAGEQVCGDAWSIYESPTKSSILVADGLGHGLGAAEASSKAVEIFQNSAHLSPKDIIEACHGALRGTRGAAIAIAEINYDQQIVRFAGVGNISGTIITSLESRSMVSYNGIVGHQLLKLQEFSYPWSSQALLVMHSDGLATQWRLNRYINLVGKHPSLIAGVLYRDFKRGRDDVTVLVARENFDY